LRRWRNAAPSLCSVGDGWVTNAVVCPTPKTLPSKEIQSGISIYQIGRAKETWRDKAPTIPRATQAVNSAATPDGGGVRESAGAPEPVTARQGKLRRVPVPSNEGIPQKCLALS